MSYRLGVDIGGTFTDFVLMELSTGELRLGKCLTTRDDPIRGILTGIARFRDDLGLPAGAIKGVSHGTTLVGNTLIERKGAATGLLVTQGFRDVLEIGNDTRYDIFDLDITFPEPLVARQFRVGVAERTAADGASIKKPDPREVRARIAELAAAGIESIAVCFFHSYRNPEHERIAKEIISKEFPNLDVSISSEVAPEIREYERMVTVTANAYVRPIMRSYLGRLQTALREAGIDGNLFVMLSNGGVTSADTASEVPIRLVESGPAGGILAASHFGKAAGYQNLFAFDMGGTTAKVCLIDQGEPAYAGTIEVAHVKRQYRGSGLPLKVPSVDMIEIGAGGGSIAHIDSTGLLKVGPESAGSDPGPACYGFGGNAATVTDADLVLGYLDPGYFLGGEMRLDHARAEAAIAAVARPLGLSVPKAAAGILQVVNNSMATAVRIHAAERGQDYRRYALFAFGGAGPVHAYELARILKLPRVICPLGAGTFSALGLLIAPPAVDLARSYYARLGALDWQFLNDLYAGMESQAAQILSAAGVSSPQFSRAAEMRFVGQGFEVTVPIPGGKLDTAAIPLVTAAFAEAYSRLYRSLPGELPIEALTWRLRAFGPSPVANLTREVETSPSRSMKGRRQAYFTEIGDFVEVPVYDRYALRSGDLVKGPAIVEERESTLVVGPSGTATVDQWLSLRMEVG